jgi:hypothetical protein
MTNINQDIQDIQQDNQDNDSHYDESDYDDYSDEDDLYFDPDEESNTRYNIVLCELYCKLHGKGNGGKLFYYYLNISSFKKLDIIVINEICNNYNTYYKELVNNLLPENSATNAPPFSSVRNFNSIVSKNDYIKPQIAENITLESGHRVCIIKTIWLKLIQRTWKRVFALRKTIIKRRSNIHSLKIRELTGKWPENCRVYPELQGMMSYLL